MGRNGSLGLMLRIARYSSATSTSPLLFANLKKSLTVSPKPLVDNAKLVFGQTFSDHMLTIASSPSGWQAPSIAPYAKLQLDPSASVLHYGVECFEGMKAYKDKHGKIRLFRPDMNMTRFLKSSTRLALPSFDRAELLKCIKEFVRTEQRWIPNERGYSLYLRPAHIATQASLGVGASHSSLIFVIASPVGPYYKTGFAPVKLAASTEYVRAWPGGTGDCKIGGNYAPGIRPQIQVVNDGFQQILWLFGPDHLITEGLLFNVVGTMNFFVYWVNEHGEKELATPPLDGTILPGVTRDSILSLAREWGIKVAERDLPMHVVKAAVKDNRVLEMFGAGTAAIVSPIKQIKYNQDVMDIPLGSKPGNKAGELTSRIADTILGIQYGEISHKWSVVVD